MIKYVVYNAGKPMELALSTVEDKVETLLDEYDPEMFKTLCGTLFYTMLETIPEFDLEDGHKYTVEMICFQAPITLVHSVHSYLDTLGDIAVKGITADRLQCLLAIDDVLSVIGLCSVEMRKVYSIFVMAYADCTQDVELRLMAEKAITDAYVLRQLRNIFGG